ncbi:unnamed protein product, partial [Musa textilis]
MVITSIVQSLLPSFLPRWGLRSMWELAAVLNFHHVPGFGNDLSSGSIFWAISPVTRIALG